jgi:hypothetical protein
MMNRGGPGGSSGIGSWLRLRCSGLGMQVVGSILSPSGFYGVQALRGRDQPRRQPPRMSGRWPARSPIGWAAIRANPGLTGLLTLPPSRQPARFALRTAGWPILAASARTSLEAALEWLCAAAGVALRTLEDCPQLAAVEAATAEAHQITMGINAWEWRWPLDSFAARDARC